MVKKSIFIFRRSYRLDDNKGLIKCCKESDKVYPVFIFTPDIQCFAIIIIQVQ